MYPVTFETNIDAYQAFRYPSELPFVPAVGMRIEAEHQGLPALTILSVRVITTESGDFKKFICHLWFGDNVMADDRIEILNHRWKRVFREYRP